ncbi:Uncharacterised protein [uncultured Clostridium sp.]|nr:Uncharacterised protein [uncultured Clostridium sp.]
MASKGLSGYYKVAETKQGYGTYYYAIFDDGNTYEKGDKILVSGVNKEVLEITDILTPDEAKRKNSMKITAEVIGKVVVDTSAYEARIEKRRVTEKLKKELDQKMKQLDEIQKYEYFAKIDPKFAKLVDEYKKVIE